MGDLTPRLGIVCGMASEVRALGRWASDPLVSVGVSGARPDRAEAEARRLAALGCGTLMSWGVAGGLDPALRPGALILPQSILTEDGARWAPSEELRALVSTRLASNTGRNGLSCGGLLGADGVIFSVTRKTALYQRTGAVAVDMETHRVARVASEIGLPFLAIRAIGDPANRELPLLAATALGEDGRPRSWAVLAGLLRRPADLGSLLRVKRDTDSALTRLAMVAKAVIPALLEAA